MREAVTLKVVGLRIDTGRWNGRIVWRTGRTHTLPANGGQLTEIVDADGDKLLIRDYLLARY